ncbi:MAG TPA: TonB-dependent receptor [Caulobacteraceae bacterium]
MVSAAVGALTLGSGAAWAQTKPITIAPQTLASALHDFGAQTGRQIMFTPESTTAKVTRGVEGATDEEVALAQLLQGTGLTYRREANVFLIVRADADPQSGSAAGGGAEVEALIVTAQKREEDIQDVPIAISAFTQEALERSQVAGGPDLMTQVPNMTFTKTNFSSYSIQLRGIGTQAISATTDPAVAVAFNNTPFVRNRFFEQEFYDLQRVEVLRGPQGTLYGRNATAGVVNIISQKPKFAYEAKVVGDVSNYSSTRLEGMVNVPLVDDIVALRLAGAWTKREGYVTNQITGNPIDGRDLWSTRLSLRFSPTDRLDANLIWEHFEEDDDRLRSGKQLCSTHNVTEVAGIAVTHEQLIPESGQPSYVQETFSQGCLPASLYSPDSFLTPNGIALPYYRPLSGVGLPIALTDPYVSRTQSTDLRVIESTVDPGYRAKSDVFELQLAYDLTDALSLSSETAWASDFIFSTQDYNRFNTASGAFRARNSNGSPTQALNLGVLDENGVFCDPQIGCADRLVAVDLSTARSRHFSQEFRLGSDFDGSFNFSLGANFLRYDTEDKYYVFINSLSLFAATGGGQDIPNLPQYEPGVSDNSVCLPRGGLAPDFNLIYPVAGCIYMDPNPIESLNDQGHNYFLSRNPYKLISYAVFGEAYYNITDNLKVTAGLRWTVDKKEAPRIPSWLLATRTLGYPVHDVIEQEWREPTGRLTVDWKPDLGFTDETLLYASIAHGYKAGGANPPPPGVVMYCPNCGGDELPNAIVAKSATHPKTFDPEFVDAFELGAKNTLLDGRVTLNLAAFYYDYTGYQISQIIERSAVNHNFDAEVWGLEIEADWRPLENLRLGFKGGYENTRVADGMQAVDVMDRTAGMPGWVLARPFPTFPSNCILPAWLFLGNTSAPGNPELVNLGSRGGGGPGGCEYAYVLGEDPPSLGHNGIINYTAYSTDPADFPGWPTDPVTGEPLPITDRTYPGWDPSTAPNNGEGFFKDLSGNELPNAPHFTATITADYTVPLPNDWLATLHTDLYYQSEAWTRIFNTEGYDKLKAYTNVNLAAIFTNEDAGWKVMAYVKNVFDRDSITGAFLNSDDSGLTTNVFLTEPRLYGLRVTKEWTGGPWWTGANPNHTGPYPLTIELGGMVQRHDAPYETVQPSFMDEFSAALNTLPSAQHRDLDWGDGREVKVTWRPNSLWSVSAGLRYGRTNGGVARLHTEEAGDAACGWAGYLAIACDPTFAGGQFYLDPMVTYNRTDTFATNREEHTMADFAIGRDAGVGVLARSAVGFGLRYAQFSSRTAVDLEGIPNWEIAEGWKYGGPPDPQKSSSDFYETHLEANREFEGWGPVLSWDAAIALLGGDDTGHLSLDWSANAGVLFGKQETLISGEESVAHFAGPYTNSSEDRRPHIPTSPAVITPVSIPRSEDVTVPMLDLSLGLSYEISRVKVGAGYRWERYFDVLDVGYDEAEDADRTIDGPYFKLAVGFGG